MITCEDFLDGIEDAMADALSNEVQAHLAQCPSCRAALDRARDQREAGAALTAVHAPETLRSELKAVARLAPACVTALERMGHALDGELADDERGALVEHLHGCIRCRACWEAFATLREVGSATRPTALVRARLSLSPRNRIDVRRRPRVDVRLATAAAYLFAALSVTLVGNPASLAREGTDRVERATVYARAAVENRLSAYGRRVLTSVEAGAAWLGERGAGTWRAVRQIVEGQRTNPETAAAVDSNGNGG